MATTYGSRSNNQINDSGTLASVCNVPSGTTGRGNAAKMWEMEKAINHLNTKAEPNSTGYCARYVCRAIEAGGIHIINPKPTVSPYTSPSAKDYGNSLVNAGFIKQCIDSSNLTLLKKGDVAVIQAITKEQIQALTEEQIKRLKKPIKEHPHGHMAMFNGSIWVSDFKQTRGGNSPYPGTLYRQVKPNFAIYRFPATEPKTSN